MQLKTARDLPEGAEVYGHCTTWVKDRPGDGEPWTDSSGDTWSDELVDRLLAAGEVTITRVPTHRPPSARIMRVAAELAEKGRQP